MLEEFLKPSCVAVVGASGNPGKVGYAALRNMIQHGFAGKIVPVNPEAEEVLGLKCYSNVLSFLGSIDLALIAVPARAVPSVVEDCGRKGVKGVVIFSSGFREVGGNGVLLERELVNLCRKFGVRMLGPNCLGVINTYMPINASFAATMPLRGGVGFISQSGALCSMVLGWSLTEQVGFSNFVSLGNKADLDEGDFIRALGEDEKTRVILLYIEGIEKGEKFLEAAEEFSRTKPIIVLKAGVSEAGARATSSHTGSIAGSDIAYEAAFKEAGVIRVRTLEELFNLTKAFEKQPMPRGMGIGIVTNAGGPGILAVDASEKYGLRMASIGSRTVDLLRKKLPPASNFHNPIDLLGDAGAGRYEFALKMMLDDPNVDALIVILTPQAMTEPEKTAEAIVKVYRSHLEKPVLAIFLGGKEVEGAARILLDSGIPNYQFPEQAVFAVRKMFDFIQRKERFEEARRVKFDVDRGKVKDVLAAVRSEGRVNLRSDEARNVVEAYGIAVPKSFVVGAKELAVSAAEEIGYPVALKVVSPEILHKTDIGCVKLNLKTPEEVERAFDDIIHNASLYVRGARVFGVEVQEMAGGGKEMIVGVTKDLQFGHLVMFGLGGIYVNLLRDVSFRLNPLTVRKAWNMMEETRAYRLLRGFRGEPPSDVASVVEVLLRVSQLVEDFKEICDMDINPLQVYEEGKGCLALDVKMTLEAK